MVLTDELARGWGAGDGAEAIAEAARRIARSGLGTASSWPAQLVPKALGGSGMKVALLAPIAEASGIAGCYPAFANAVDAVSLLRRCATPEADRVLTSLAEGRVKPVLDSCPLPGEADDGTLRVVLCDNGDAPVLRVVPAGEAVRGELTLADRLDPGAVESVLAVGAALDAAAVVGLGRQALALTVEHARTRIQFDQPVGTFQAVQHHCVDMFLLVEQTRTLTADAFRSLQAAPILTREVMYAKIKAAEMSVDAFRRAHRIHGGIGYSSDSPLGALTRSALVIRGMHGSALWHRARLRELLRTTPSALPDSGVHDGDGADGAGASFVVRPTDREAALPNSQRAHRGVSASSPSEG